MACASTRPVKLETISEAPETPPRPAGIAADPASALPQPLEHAHADQGLAVLRAPADSSSAKKLVQQFFHAAVHEDSEALSELILETAWLRTSAAGSRHKAKSFWLGRLSRLDYRVLQGETLYRPHELELYRAKDMAELPHQPNLPFMPQGSELVVRVPLVSAAPERSKLFGDEMFFLLRVTDSGYRIAEIIEDFRMP